MGGGVTAVIGQISGHAINALGVDYTQGSPVSCAPISIGIEGNAAISVAETATAPARGGA
jgi:hypothetical protein